MTDTKKWKEKDPDPECKKCDGRGHDTDGEDCDCLWEEIKND